ncbi:hypothetical protein DD582_32490 [Klebsiella pneumoniae]|nr:hypothetical protein DD582_32490 [Klebsiella pneumoniae]
MALGHQQLWLHPPEDYGIYTCLIDNWDGRTVAERILVSGSWWLTTNASVIYTNPEGIGPGDLEELTWLSVQRQMKN